MTKADPSAQRKKATAKKQTPTPRPSSTQEDLLAALAVEITEEPERPQVAAPEPALNLCADASQSTAAVPQPAPAAPERGPGYMVSRVETERAPALWARQLALASAASAAPFTAQAPLLPPTHCVVVPSAQLNAAQQVAYDEKGIQVVTAAPDDTVSRWGGVKTLQGLSTDSLNHAYFLLSLERMGDDRTPQEDLISLLRELQRVSAHGAMIEIRTISPYYADLTRDPFLRRVLSADLMQLLDAQQRAQPGADFLEPLRDQLNAAGINLVLQQQSLSLTAQARTKIKQLQAQSQALRAQGAADHEVAAGSDQVLGQEYVLGQAKEVEPQALVERVRKLKQQAPKPTPIILGLSSFVNFNGKLTQPLSTEELNRWVRSDPAAYTSSNYTLLNLKYPYQAVATVQIPPYAVPGYQEDPKPHAEPQGTAPTKSPVPEEQPHAAANQGAAAASAAPAAAESAPAPESGAAPSIKLGALLQQPFTMVVHDEREQLGAWEMYQSRQLRTRHQVDALGSNYLRFFLHSILLRKADQPVKVTVVGADVGWFALLSARTHARITVDAFEPNAQKCRLLNYNVSLNGYNDQIKVYHGALGAKAGSAAGNGAASGTGSSAHQISYVYAYDPQLKANLSEELQAAPDTVILADNDLLEHQDQILGSEAVTCERLAANSGAVGVTAPALASEWEAALSQFDPDEVLFDLHETMEIHTGGTVETREQTCAISAEFLRSELNEPSAPHSGAGQEDAPCLGFKPAYDLLRAGAFFGATPFIGRGWWQPQAQRPQALLTYHAPHTTLSEFYLKAQGQASRAAPDLAQEAAPAAAETTAAASAAQWPDLVVVDAHSKVGAVVAGMTQLLDAGARPIIYVRLNLHSAVDHALSSGTQFSFAPLDELEARYGYIAALIVANKGLRLADPKLRAEVVMPQVLRSASQFERVGRFNRQRSVGTGAELMHLFYLPKEHFELSAAGLRPRT